MRGIKQKTSKGKLIKKSELQQGKLRETPTGNSLVGVKAMKLNLK